MKNSKEFKNWQNDLTYLSYAYNINPVLEAEQKYDVLNQIMLATETLPEEIRQLMDGHSGASLVNFLHDAADSLYELCRLLQLTLSLNLISLDEYHTMMESINEIGQVIKKFISQFKSANETDNNTPVPDDFAYWVLN